MATVHWDFGFAEWYRAGAERGGTAVGTLRGERR